LNRICFDGTLRAIPSDKLIEIRVICAPHASRLTRQNRNATTWLVLAHLPLLRNQQRFAGYILKSDHSLKLGATKSADIAGCGIV
jgi:hypothetical protein